MARKRARSKATEQDLRERVLKESNWELIVCQYNSILKTRELIRVCTTVTDNEMEQAIRLLDLYTSARNKDQQRWVKDPQAGNQPFPGTWRLVTNRMSEKGEPDGVVQVLREGWATELTDDESRFENFLGSPATGTRSFTQFWQNIDITVTESLANTLNDTAIVTDPVVETATVTGTFAASQVTGVVMPEDGAGRISRVLSEVAAIEAAADLSSLDPILQQGNTILNLFGLQQGEADYFTFTFTNINPASRLQCMGISDADLVSTLADKDEVAWVTGTEYLVGAIVTESGTTYTCLVAHTAGTFATDLSAGKWSELGAWNYADRRFKEQSDGTAHFIVLFKKVAWNLWGHDAYAADITDYPRSAGTTNEKEVIRKVWQYIRNADLATAVSDARTGTNVAAEAGYIITSVTVSENGNGSFSISQLQKKQVDGDAEDGSEVANPHSLNPGTLTYVVTLYENYTNATLPAGSAIGGNIIYNREFLQGDGLWGRKVISKTPAWTNNWAGAIKMGERNASGFALTETNEATGIPESGRAAAFTAAQSASAATRNVLMTRLIERANGERIIQQMEGRLYEGTTSGDAIVIEESLASGGGRAAVLRVWHRRTAAAKNTLVAVGGAARSNFTYNALTYTHSKLKITDHGEGAWTVYQLGTIPSLSLWTIIDNDEGEVVEEQKEMLVRISLGSETYSRVLYTRRRQIFSTALLAAQYADGSHTYYKETGNQAVEVRMGYTRRLGDGKYAGYLETYVDPAPDPWVVP